MLTRFLLLAGFALLIAAGSQATRRGGGRDSLGDAHSYRPPNFGCAGAAMAAKQHPAEARAVLEAANDAWDAHSSVFYPAIDQMDVYALSRRILEAKRALAADQKDDIVATLSHWQRMKSEYLKIKALYITGAKGGGADVLADARYYVAEAELWLVAAGGTVPEKLDFVTKDTDKSAWQWKNVPTPDEPVPDD